MRRQLDLFLCAVQFLTRIPTPRLEGFEPDWTSRSARYFPLVGQLVGAVCALTLWGASKLWAMPVAALLAIAAGVLITGGFHEDGLADTADGLGGGQDAARRLAIMKDSRIGTYGVLALGLTVALKLAALASMAALHAAAALLAAHSLGRAAAVCAMRATPYAGDPSAAKWKPALATVTPFEVSLALALGAWPLLLLPLSAAGLGLAIGAGLGFGLLRLAQRLIGGHTGDVLGAVEQLFELGFLLGASAVPWP